MSASRARRRRRAIRPIGVPPFVEPKDLQKCTACELWYPLAMFARPHRGKSRGAQPVKRCQHCIDKEETKGNK